MNYLKKLFHEFLNEEGEVSVAGYPFYRDQILRELEKQGYNEAFDDWKMKRKENNLEIAKTILDEYDNAFRFRKLQEIYNRGKVIPFVGAGLSMPSGYPGWTGFLRKVLTETRVDTDTFEKMLENGEYEEAAQLLSDDLPAGCFLEQVENYFGYDCEIVGPVQRIPYVFKDSVITTNFDSVIDRCYSDAQLDFEEVLLGAEAQELPRALGENKRVLVKLHGKANSSRNRILTKVEYDKHYSSSAELEKVIEVISSNTLLFVGCSLSVDRTIKCLANIALKKNIETIPRHYAFLKLNESDDRLSRRDELALAGIHPIWYTGDHDECIEALLEKLSEGDKR